MINNVTLNTGWEVPSIAAPVFRVAEVYPSVLELQRCNVVTGVQNQERRCYICFHTGGFLILVTLENFGAVVQQDGEPFLQTTATALCTASTKQAEKGTLRDRSIQSAHTFKSKFADTSNGGAQGELRNI